MIHDLFWTVLAWSLLLPLSFCLGLVFRRFIPTEDSILKGIVCYALGFALLSYSVVVLSYLHLLNPIAIWISLIMLLALSHRWIPEWIEWLKSVSRELLAAKSPASTILKWIFLASFIALLLGTLTPEIGGDALCYHLNLPKVFLEAGSLNPIRFDDNSFYPLFMNNLYLIGLATGSVFSAKLFHFFCGFLLFLATFRIIHNETKNKTLGYFIGLVTWLTPTIYNMISTTYVDVAVAFYSFLALWTLITAFDQEHAGPFFISGLLIGCAISIKYLSLYSAIALFPLWIFPIVNCHSECPKGAKNLSFISKCRSFASLRMTVFSGFIAWGLGAFLACGYWLIRNWILTGNPFYPFWASLFGLPEQRAAATYYSMGMGKGLWEAASVFWNMVILPSQFGMFATRISAFYFLFIPFVLIGGFLVKRGRPYFLFFIVFFIVWFELVQADRWVIPLLPVMGVLAGFGINWLDSFASNPMKKIFKWGAGSVAILCLGVYALSGIYHYRHAAYLFTGQWSETQYLEKMERTAPIARWINQNLSGDSKILIEAEPQKFYIDRPVISDKNLEWHTQYQNKGYNPQQLSEYLKSLGVTHLLISDPLGQPVSPIEGSPVRQLARSEYAAKVHEASSQNIRDARYFYRLYVLK